MLIAIREGEKLASTRRSHHFGRVCATGKRTFTTQGPLLGSSYKDNGKASETHIHYFRRRLQRGPLPDNAAIGWQHPCENLTDNGAHIGEICKAAQLWSPSTWAARSVPSNPCWEGNTWRGYTGEQSRPYHLLLSVDLASPPVTVDFLSSRNLRGTALASIDHAPLRDHAAISIQSIWTARRKKALRQGDWRRQRRISILRSSLSTRCRGGIRQT